MPQGDDSERIPLLRGPFHNVYYLTNNNERRRNLFSLIGYGFIILATLLFSVNLIYYFVESSEVMLPKGNSKIPNEYYLGLKDNDWTESSEFEYVIETSPPSDPTFSKLFEDYSNSTELSYDRLKLAEILARSYKAWSPAYYEVREARYGSENFTVLTTQSHMSGIWFIIWTPKVHVSFVTSNNNYNEENNDGDRETRFIDDDVEKLLKCEYEMTWTYKYFGEIYRRCSNGESWNKVAYVKGTSEWGMQWLDPERIETYGIVTKPAYGENKQMRSVVIRPDSPFPPILPALYLAYFDRIINREESNSLL